MKMKVGEAAGFQDYLAAFGMNYAIRSGYLAAQSIIKKHDYDQLWRKDFKTKLQMASINRHIFNELDNKTFEDIVQILNSQNLIFRIVFGQKDFRRLLKILYINPFYNSFFKILAKSSLIRSLFT
jgi:flavin-dependent dehydrogenase